eukprot:TRINITY_DN5314_c0_g1_i1.p1 TRINITY_DN5314_c0_g1~~TRINITY_DN5314_c0_g1_i1.p1  ORF type:complete len:190 (-),score=39.18 TRINITY_DN5314_c0_g1_i1:4-573(-)
MGDAPVAEKIVVTSNAHWINTPRQSVAGTASVWSEASLEDDHLVSFSPYTLLFASRTTEEAFREFYRGPAYAHGKLWALITAGVSGSILLFHYTHHGFGNFTLPFLSPFVFQSVLLAVVAGLLFVAALERHRERMLTAVQCIHWLSFALMVVRVRSTMRFTWGWLFGCDVLCALFARPRFIIGFPCTLR